MPKYRFPGKIEVPSYCNKPCEPKPFTIIKPCPPKPFIKDTACRANIYDRGVIRTICHCDIPFVIDCFHIGLVVVPVNLDLFCDYDFKDGEIVAVEAEDASSCCNNKYSCLGLPVNIYNIKRVWRQEIRKATGVVSLAKDNNNVNYYKVTETYDPTSGKPYSSVTENSLTLNLIRINYDIYNIIGGYNPADLVGKTINFTYVDYGTETPERDGIPIVITQFTILE